MTERARKHPFPLPWGLRPTSPDSVPALVIEARWRWPAALALAATIPAFYLEMLRASRPLLATLAYLLAAAVNTLALLHTGWRSGRIAEHLRANPLDLVLGLGLLLAAVLPPSSQSQGAGVLRMVVALLTLVRMVWAGQHLFRRGSLVQLLVFSGGLLLLCGAGYWWLEPTTPTLEDGIWLAFVTAATVGYGDVVPTTAASKVFSVFVVMLGFAVLSLVTAAVAAHLIETEERVIEREILRDLHRQVGMLHREIAALRQDLALRDAAPADADSPPRARRSP